MIRRIPRAIAGLLLGGLAGAAALVILYSLSSAVVLEMDHDRSRPPRGFYGGERDGTLTFAWTTARGDISLPGLDRSLDWHVRVRLRAARADARTIPDVTLLADGVAIARQAASNDFGTIEGVVPARQAPDRGLTISIASSSVFVPGPHDRRELGVQVDRIEIAPGRRGAFPPRGAVAAAMAASAIFGGIFGLLGATAGTAVGAATLLAVAQANVLRRGLGPFAPWIDLIVPLAAAIGIALVAGVAIAERHRRGALRNTARFAVMFTAGSTPWAAGFCDSDSERWHMALIDDVSRGITEAMKARDQDTLATLRMLKSALTLKEVEKGRALDDAEALQVVSTLVKQRRDSIDQFTRGGRQDLADKEARELAILERLLPPAAGPERIAEAVDAAIAETGAQGAKDFGKVMKAAMARLSGTTVDGRAVSEAVKARLG